MAELNPERRAEVERLFVRAVDLLSEERAGFLQQECVDEEVRSEVASLLEHAGRGLTNFDAVMASAVAELAGEVNPDERLVGTRLGAYRLVSIAGYGGMGAVYRASREDGEFHQQVAIKLVRAAAESPNALQKFRQERQIMARFSHPNIARLLDGGSTPEGVPYLVMEFIEGESITNWCANQALSTRERLRIFLLVCEGVDAAHRELVIHRDLKPSNILVNRDGNPKLLDFGIAKLLEPDEDEQDKSQTETRFRAMTPEYAAPEQVRGEPVTAATDIYALGLVLYEILTGVKAQRVSKGTPAKVAEIVCQLEPTRPALVNPQLSRDLDQIIRMAIRKEPERRYQTAAELGEDIRRYLAGKPVLARPDTVAYRTTKFASRHRVGLAASIISAALLVGGLMLAYWFGEPSKPRVLQIAQLTQDAHVDINSRIATDGSMVYFSERTRGKNALAQVPVTGGTPSLLKATPLSNPAILDISPDGSRLLVKAADEAVDDPPVWIVPKAGGLPSRVGDVEASYAVWSRDGREIFFLAGAALFRINVDGTARHKLVDIPEGSYGLRLAPAPESQVLRLSVFKRDMQSSSIWEVGIDGTGLHPLVPVQDPAAGWPDALYVGDWISSGRYYMLRSRQGAVSNFWALRKAQGLLWRNNGQPIKIYATPLESRSFTPSLDGKRIFFGAAQIRAEFVRYDRAREQFLPFLRGITGRHLGISKDRQEVAYTTAPDDILWKSLADGSGRLRLTPASGMRAFRPCWSPDGKFIAFTGSKVDQPSRVYLIPSGGGTPEPIGSAPFESDPSWSPDGNSLLLTRLPRGTNGTPGIYKFDRRTRKSELLTGSEALTYGEWSPDGRYIAATREQGELQLLDLRTNKWIVLAHGSGILPFWSRDGKYIYFQDVSGEKDQPIYGVRISDRKVEKLMNLSQIPQSDVTDYQLIGLAADDAPIARVTHSNSDIYALDLDLP